MGTHTPMNVDNVVSSQYLCRDGRNMLPHCLQLSVYHFLDINIKSRKTYISIRHLYRENGIQRQTLHMQGTPYKGIGVTDIVTTCHHYIEISYIMAYEFRQFVFDEIIDKVWHTPCINRKDYAET